ncbi:MAG TPA: DUF4388 domain-containing protein [Thermoanaerobaculia bacterium]|nr:DUF4388 domain-containing protein [Thermoanaerobaculia bacterium]
MLTFLHTTRKSGTLTLTVDSRESWLFFDSGSLIYAGSNQEQFRLNAVLLRKRHISRDDAVRIDELMRREGGRFGQIAIKEGVLTSAQLQDALKVQVSEIVYDCFVWSGGNFSFGEETKLPPHAVTISIDLPNLIMEGARRIDEWEQCVRLLPDKAVVFRVVTAPKDEKITLTSDEWKILFLINGQRSLEELCHDAEEDPFHVYRLVYGLLANHLIEQVPREMPGEDTTGRMRAVDAPDDTMRQGSPRFGAESTIHEVDDDTSLLVSSDANLSYSDVVRPTVAQLVLDLGDDKGTIIPLIEPEYLIGRSRDNGIQLHDLGVSGFHARLYRGPEGFVIEDLKSRNGTWLNGSRVFHATLSNGDRLRLGATEILYEVLFDGTRVS